MKILVFALTLLACGVFGAIVPGALSDDPAVRLIIAFGGGWVIGSIGYRIAELIE